MEKLIFLIILLSIGCRNDNYNKMIDWTNSIPKGTDINEVKSMQPQYLIIDWENPDTTSKGIEYMITVKNNYDPLNMSNALFFIDNKYKGRNSGK